MHRSLPFLLLCWLTGACAAQEPAKKLIEYGWDVPTAKFVKEHIREMEARPFNGIVLTLDERLHAFYPQPYQTLDLDDDFAALKAIEWGTFTDNFLALHAIDNWSMDWFDDARWSLARDNLTWLSAQVAGSGLKGFCFDPEDPAGHVFEYTRWQDRPFPVVEAKVRQRGREFMTALQSSFPDVTIFSLFNLSALYPTWGYPDRAEREAALQKHQYGLLPAFFNGMLEVAGPQVSLVDGNESSYSYQTKSPFLEIPGIVGERVLPLVDPALYSKYRAQVELGQAVYVDALLALDQDRPYPTHSMTREERLLYVGHNVYWGVRTSDRYTWIYSERMNWWENDVPPMLEDVIRQAADMARRGEALGYEMDAYHRQAAERQQRGIRYD